MNKQEQRRELWRQRIAEQEKSGHSVRVFCRERDLSEASLYAWRKRLRTQNSGVRFALVETKPATEMASAIELVLAGGDRLRIPQDAATLKLVLAVLRQQE
ncbi:MAG TPA: transposase [Acidobacteriaceae bacterium]